MTDKQVQSVATSFKFFFPLLFKLKTLGFEPTHVQTPGQLHRKSFHRCSQTHQHSTFIPLSFQRAISKWPCTAANSSRERKAQWLRGQESRSKRSRGEIQQRDAHSLRHGVALYGGGGLSGCAAGSVLTRRIWPLDPNQSLVNTIGWEG